MPSLADFQKSFKEDPAKALTDYVIHIDQSLDGTVGADGVLTNKPFGEQDVVFEYVDPSIIKMRAKIDSDVSGKSIWYLPWVSKGAAKADLDEKGSRYFSTSQLNGCRFTIQYADATKKKATVLHLAGNFDFKLGTKTRDDLETAEIGAVGDAKLRRRYSIGQSSIYKVTKFNAATRHYEILGDETRVYYGGNKASIFGYRDKDGAWHFWAHEMYEDHGSADVGMGKKDLS